MPLLDLPSGTLAWAEEGAGPLLVLLHGCPGDSRDFDGIVPALAARHRVLLVDWPGYGESPAPAVPENLRLDDLYRLWCELVAALHLGPLIVLGNGVGGYVAARYAIDAPEQVSALALVAPSGFTPHNALTRAVFRAQGSSLLSLPPRVQVQLCLRRQTAVTREMRLRARYEQSTPGTRLVERALWRDLLEPAHDLRPVAADIVAPALLVFGRYDPVAPARRDGRAASALMPQARYCETNTGHAPFAEAPADFLALLEAFLAEAATTGGD